MRADFTKAALAELSLDSRAVFITGDLGFRALEGLANALGRRFINAGVAEQGMIGISAGLAFAGYRPWVYSIAPFATFRCLEQIRNDLCHHDFNVKIVGNGGGYTYGVLGSTHHALEDLAVLKPLPNLRLFFPCSNGQVADAVRRMASIPHPAYLRLAISGFPADDEPLSENSETLTRHYRRGDSVTVIGVGHATQIALTAAARHGLAEADVDLFGVARFPLDLESDRGLVESARRTRKVLVIEEHYQPGGIAESLRLALPDTDAFEAMTATYSSGFRYGSPAFHLRQTGLTPERVVERALRLGKGGT